MANNTEQRFREADAAVDQAVDAFIGKIESMSGKWDAVARSYIVERMLPTLCDEIVKLIDDPDFAKHSIGSAMMKLSKALADYRDARWADR
jgi:hypothetical protein